MAESRGDVRAEVSDGTGKEGDEKRRRGFEHRPDTATSSHWASSLARIQLACAVPNLGVGVPYWPCRSLGPSSAGSTRGSPMVGDRGRPKINAAGKRRADRGGRGLARRFGRELTCSEIWLGTCSGTCSGTWVATTDPKELAGRAWARGSTWQPSCNITGWGSPAHNPSCAGPSADLFGIGEMCNADLFWGSRKKKGPELEKPFLG